VRHTSPTFAGLTLTAATLTWTVASWVQAQVVERTGPRRLVTAGLVLVLLGLAGITALLAHGVPVWLAPVAWAVAGFGMGLSYAPISLTALGWASPGQEGRASSAVQLLDVLGTALGTGIAGAAVAVGDAHTGDLRPGLTVGFVLAGAVAVVGITLRRRLPLRTSPPGREQPEGATPT
jgi:MFS family permease